MPSALLLGMMLQLMCLFITVRLPAASTAADPAAKAALLDLVTTGDMPLQPRGLEQRRHELLAEARPLIQAELLARQQASGVAAAAAASTSDDADDGKVDQAPSTYTIEHAALLAIFNSLPNSRAVMDEHNIHAETNHCTDWGGAGQEDSLHVICENHSPTGRIIYLDLYSMVYGSLPTEQLATFSKLKYLYIGNHHELLGELPASWPAILPDLEILLVFMTGISGQIPASWGNWPKLRYLELGGNRLTGTIPKELGSLSNLVHLDVEGNQLVGTIPHSLSSLTKLQRLDLASNQLTGQLPGTSFWQPLQALQVLDLGNNLLSGTVEDAAWSSHPSLTHITASNNRLSGPLPKLTNLPSLQALLLDANEFSGDLPEEFAGLPSVYLLQLRANHLSGRLPSAYSTMASLRILDLSSNTLSGSLPDSWHALEGIQVMRLHLNCLSGQTPCSWNPGNLKALRYLSLCFNPASQEACADAQGNLAASIKLPGQADAPSFSSSTLMGCVSAGFTQEPGNDRNPLVHCPGYISADWQTDTGLTGFCGIESWSRASAAPVDDEAAGTYLPSICIKQSNSPGDVYCRGAAPKPQQPLGVFNKGPSAGVMRSILPPAPGLPDAAACDRGNTVGEYSARCGVDSRGREVMAFSMTTANSDNVIKSMFWTGCKPPRSDASPSSHGAKGLARRLCNDWRNVPATARKAVNATHTSVSWDLTFPKTGVSPVTRGCTCFEVWWSLYAKAGTVCGVAS